MSAHWRARVCGPGLGWSSCQHFPHLVSFTASTSLPHTHWPRSHPLPALTRLLLSHNCSCHHNYHRHQSLGDDADAPSRHVEQDVSARVCDSIVRRKARSAQKGERSRRLVPRSDPRSVCGSAGAPFPSVDEHIRRRSYSFTLHTRSGHRAENEREASWVWCGDRRHFAGSRIPK